MLRDMDNLEASGVFHVKVGTFTHLEQSNISLLTVNTMGIVKLTIQPDMIASVTFMEYPWDSLTQKSADIHSLIQCPIHM